MKNPLQQNPGEEEVKRRFKALLLNELRLRPLFVERAPQSGTFYRL